MFLMFHTDVPNIQYLGCNCCKSLEHKLYHFQGGRYCQYCMKVKKQSVKKKWKRS